MKRKYYEYYNVGSRYDKMTPRYATEDEDPQYRRDYQPYDDDSDEDEYSRYTEKYDYPYDSPDEDEENEEDYEDEYEGSYDYRYEGKRVDNPNLAKYVKKLRKKLEDEDCKVIKTIVNDSRYKDLFLILFTSDYGVGFVIGDVEHSEIGGKDPIEIEAPCEHHFWTEENIKEIGEDILRCIKYNDRWGLVMNLLKFQKP